MKILRIDGIIGDFMNTSEEIQWRIDNLGLEQGEELKVIINSPGGSVFEGFAIYNMLVASTYEINTEIEGLCGSIATLICMAAEKKNTSISEVAMFMIHKAATGVQGNSEELEKQAEILKSIDETLISVYSARTGKTRNEVEKLLSEETWFNATNTVKEGFIGNIINRIDGKVAAIAHQSQITQNMKIIDDLLKKYRGETVTLTKEEQEAKAEKERFDALTPDEQTAELEAVEKARFDALTPDEQAAELKAIEDAKIQANTEFATKEDFDKLEVLVTGLTKVLSEQKPVEEVVKEAVAIVGKGLPRSKGTPQKGQINIAQANAYVDPHQKQRDEIKEIEEKTRIQ